MESSQNRCGRVDCCKGAPQLVRKGDDEILSGKAALDVSPRSFRKRAWFRPLAIQRPTTGLCMVVTACVVVKAR